MLRRALACLIGCLLLVGGPTAFAQDATSPLATADRRLAVVAERLQGANVALCRQLMPLTGLILHSADQYGQPSLARFAQGSVALAQVLPGSPGEMAGLAENDALVAIGGHAVRALVQQPGHPLRDSVFDLLAAQDPARPVALAVRRSGQDLAVNLSAPPGCRVLVEVLTDGSNRARSDGRVLQVTQDMVARLSDHELAVVVAHELAHAVLEHRRRLEVAGVKTGLLGEFGRNRRLRRVVEEEADLLSVHLLANAGFDPAIAARFWRSEAGSRTDGGLLRSGAYRSPEQRAALMEAEVAMHLTGSVMPSLARHLLDRREAPFPSR